jgi:hypothetical protein
VRRRLAFSVEIVFISALILVTRCANYGDVFFGGQINFIDADCFAECEMGSRFLQGPTHADSNTKFGYALTLPTLCRATCTSTRAIAFATL